jgi:hypothetical protein
MSAPRTTEGASQSVFSTPELLESVLEQLPLRSLLVDAQRVDRSWLKAIAASPSLQQKLFFESCGTRQPDFNPSFNGPSLLGLTMFWPMNRKGHWAVVNLSKDWNGIEMRRPRAHTPDERRAGGECFQCKARPELFR